MERLLLLPEDGATFMAKKNKLNMKRISNDLHLNASIYRLCFRKVVVGKEKGAKPYSLTPYISVYYKYSNKFAEPFPQTRTLPG